MGGAELDPFRGELGAFVQQGQEIGGKGGDAACGLGSHDAAGGDIHQTHPDTAVGGQLAHHLVENGGIGGLTLGLTVPNLLLPELQGFCVFFHGFQTAHKGSSLFVVQFIIIPVFGKNCNWLRRGLWILFVQCAAVPKIVIHHCRAGACSRHRFCPQWTKSLCRQAKIRGIDCPSDDVTSALGGSHGGSKPPPYCWEYHVFAGRVSPYAMDPIVFPLYFSPYFW